MNQAKKAFPNLPDGCQRRENIRCCIVQWVHLKVGFYQLSKFNRRPTSQWLSVCSVVSLCICPNETCLSLCYFVGQLYWCLVALIWLSSCIQDILFAIHVLDDLGTAGAAEAPDIRPSWSWWVGQKRIGADKRCVRGSVINRYPMSNLRWPLTSHATTFYTCHFMLPLWTMQWTYVIYTYKLIYVRRPKRSLVAYNNSILQTFNDKPSQLIPIHWA